MRRIASGAALLLFAVGCGSSASSTCDNFGNALNNLSTKYAACGTFPSFGFDKNSCVEAYNNSHCSDADKQKINDFANCVNNLPNCTPATQGAWGTAFQNCATPLSTINC